MLHYLVGPAAEQAAVDSGCDVQERRRGQSAENCPADTQPPSTACRTPPADNSGIPAAAPSTGKQPADADARLLELTSSGNHDVLLPAIVLDRVSVVARDHATAAVPKKRGRKPKRRRRVAASTVKRPETSSTLHDSNVAADSSRARDEVNLNPDQPSDVKDKCSSAKEAVAPVPVDPRPAPRKRGRKPKQLPEVVIVDDVAESGRSPLATAPRSGSGRPGRQPMTLTASLRNGSSTAALATSGGNGNAGADSCEPAADATPRRRGRKRKAAASETDAGRRQAKVRVNKDVVVQSVWKVTTPASSSAYSGNVVPRIKVTNIRATSDAIRTGSTEISGDAVAGAVTAVTTASDGQSHGRPGGGGGRQGALMVKSWQPIARRTDLVGGGKTVPVLERAREWIHATPKPSREDWTGPVFPAREVVRAGGGDRDGPSGINPPAVEAPYPLQPAKSPTTRIGSVDLHVGSPSQLRTSAAVVGAVGHHHQAPLGNATNTGIDDGPRSSAAAVTVDATSELMYVFSQGDARGPLVASAQRRQLALPPNSVAAGRSVCVDAAAARSSCSAYDRQLLNAAVCSFANDPRAGQYMTKRVGLRLLLG